MVEVKLLCNFSKIAKICNIFPNKGTLLNRLSWTRYYECDSFIDSHYTPFPLHLSLWGIQNWFEKRPHQCKWTRIALDGKLQQRVVRISERTRVANITDFSVEVRTLEKDPYFSRFLYRVSKISNFYEFCNFLIFFNIFYRNWESSQPSTMEFLDC